MRWCLSSAQCLPYSTFTKREGYFLLVARRLLFSSSFEQEIEKIQTFSDPILPTNASPLFDCIISLFKEARDHFLFGGAELKEGTGTEFTSANESHGSGRERCFPSATQEMFNHGSSSPTPSFLSCILSTVCLRDLKEHSS